MQFMIAEPFRIKMVERIKKTTKEERQQWLKQARYNAFQIKAENVYIDCITDSGTSAMSSEQWSALMLGDESYAGSKSFYKLEASVQDIFGMPFVQPTHQGRAADYIMAKLYAKEGKYAIGNMHFDTFRGNAEVLGALAVDYVVDNGKDTASPPHPFKGNIDLGKMQSLIDEKGAENISVVIITVTCNNNGGQPVSMQNIREVSNLAKRHNIPVVIDAARLAENAYFIQQREEGYKHKSIKEITREMFSYCETATMSSKKDGLVNIGGLFVSRNEEVFIMAQQLAIVHEGFITYGGLSGRDLEALAVGLQEGVDEQYLEYRINQVKYLGDLLKEKGVPIIEPTGGHGVYVDGRRFFPHIPQKEFPSQRLVVALYEEAGVRAVELGACAFGSKDKETGEDIYPDIEAMRIAISRRVYTNSHINVIANALGEIYKNRDQYKGMKLVYEGPITSLRHFTAGFELYKS
ncbi:aminotransferase class I/II-fold pyridoxal phosphate-dependent enzyme [Neobacillus notoginsengisoli]|uniref:Aminotransferase class I/II-fold pyridoxal phosphate-dependent enzyme n=1 Tax=Neobacillus notoginsengisoli TaxID=1578198 RepID=A0A417YYQ6_9BACI|nr:tryptophanase [Neobacillus notoginsengisoli]RHW42844.1 aminotransferase class I/II-fold pyridoxal phosphate-dependent enzyme [Neobacillus notoginsengisoli]